MKRIVIKRIWHGMASIRDYQVPDDDDLLIVLKETHEVMIIPKDEIKESIKKISEPFRSKHGTKPYRLIDFLWKPKFIQERLL